jgi:L-alanine-DL-glutamate epimerase-like enolase superfamily enzyme
MLSAPNCDFYEWWLPREIHQWGVTQELALTGDCRLTAPDKPGLGMELDEEWIARHRVATL